MEGSVVLFFPVQNVIVTWFNSNSVDFVFSHLLIMYFSLLILIESLYKEELQIIL